MVEYYLGSLCLAICSLNNTASCFVCLRGSETFPFSEGVWDKGMRMIDIWQVSEEGGVYCVQYDCGYVVVVVNTFWKDNVIV